VVPTISVSTPHPGGAPHPACFAVQATNPGTSPQALDQPCRARPADAVPGRGAGSCRFVPDYRRRRDLGCRRPKAKYESGMAPKELTMATTAAHSHFGPRIWLAGRRLMSMSAAILRQPSATAAAMISLRLRSLRWLLCRLAAMTSSAYMAGIPDRVHPTSARQPHCVTFRFSGLAASQFGGAACRLPA
jgi:hypothetical protein